MRGTKKEKLLRVIILTNLREDTLMILKINIKEKVLDFTPLKGKKD